jgi:hypothetical protein
MDEADDTRWLIYRGPGRGQGMGSTLRGVAAALMLADRYNRSVCVAWRSFALAFESQLECPPKSLYFTSHAGMGTALLDPTITFEAWSFDREASSSAVSPLPDALLSGNARAVVMQGDGGSHIVLSHHRERRVFPFSPRPQLAALLELPRRMVVHLRVGDPHEHTRRGLFGNAAALDRIRAALPRDAFILSDSNSVYDALCDHFVCPIWRAVPHSAERDAAEPKLGSPTTRDLQHLYNLQSWADWWTIRTATHHVLHTPSAFSESALHFSNAVGCVLVDAQSLTACTAGAVGNEEVEVRVELRMT